MFLRKIRNRSGSTSVKVISKEGGKYSVVKSFGSACDPDSLVQLVASAETFIRNQVDQPALFSLLTKEDIAVLNAFESLDNLHIRVIGPELIFGTLFDRIGFNAVTLPLFRHLVVARLCYPGSKLKTVDYLYRYQGIRLSEDTLYRFMDKLKNDYKSQVEQIAFDYAKKLLGHRISVVFYDMTTLYFEAEDEDDLRKIGFSKDGKFQQPQIMIGLLVGRFGYPIGYDIFEGNTYEGHTLVPILKKIEKKYKLGKPVVVADSALLSKNNLEELSAAGYRYILGARIKNESGAIKKKILAKAKKLTDGDSLSVKKPDGIKLIVTYSRKRAKKDASNREKGLEKLKERIGSGKLSKEQLNNRGYNKFLSLEGDVSVMLDETKVTADEDWDGLKGYVTNTTLSKRIVVEHYGHLWQIEQAFRISKSDLRIRPIFHRLKGRIEAHISIAFTAYSVYKELERLLREGKSSLSPKRASELTRNMYEIEYRLPNSKQTMKTVAKMDNEQQELYRLIHN